MKCSFVTPLYVVAATSLIGFIMQTWRFSNLETKTAHLESKVEVLQSTVEGIVKTTEERRILHEDPPFKKDGEGWWVAEPEMFRFPAGIVIGPHYKDCTYGKAVLSVNADTGKDFDLNCPSGDGTVTFGASNQASGLSSSVLGGVSNIASGNYSSVSAGNVNEASGLYSSVSAGLHNKKSGTIFFLGGGGGE
mmetsp:Transcript_18/g.39  ORF Transcript_18/g.39 Transcript_18/m.39 type:complete len:192 (-) Transcript_18:1-576(-)